MVSGVTGKIARNIRAAFDPAVPTDRAIKNWIAKNESNLKFGKDPAPEYSIGDAYSSKGLPEFSFYLRGNTPFYVAVDQARSQVCITRGWTEPRFTVVKFADIVGTKGPQKQQAASEVGDAPRAAKRIAGKVEYWNDAKGFGFLMANSGGDHVFAHKSQIEKGPKTLRQGQKVTYETTEGPKGPTALHIRVE